MGRGKGRRGGAGREGQKEERLPCRDDVKLVLRGLPTSVRVVPLSTSDIFRLATKIDTAAYNHHVYNLRDVMLKDINPFLRGDILRERFKYERICYIRFVGGNEITFLLIT